MNNECEAASCAADGRTPEPFEILPEITAETAAILTEAEGVLLRIEGIITGEGEVENVRERNVQSFMGDVTELRELAGKINLTAHTLLVKFQR